MNKNNTNKPSIHTKLKHFKQIITVEPLLASFIFAIGLCRPLIENLELEKSCRVNLKFNNTICNAILSGQHENWTKENRLVQVQISNMRSWQQPVQSIMPLVLVLFLGSFSDRYKCRKPFLIVPIIGELLSLVGCLLNIVYMREWSLEVLGITRHVLQSFFGGTPMLIMASISYIADHTTIESRTTRIGVIQIVLSVSSLLVQPLSGLLLLQFGSIYIVIAAISLQLFSIVYGLLWIHEDRPENVLKGNLFKNIFNPQHAVDTFKMLSFNKKSYHIHIIFNLLVMILFKSALLGETSVFFLYTQATFKWTPVEYGYFLGLNSLINLIGTTATITLLSKLLKFNDLTIILIALSDRVATNIIYGLAKTPAVFYIGVALSALNGVTKVVLRSFTTKIVSKDDLGKAISVSGVFEAIIPMIAVPIYNKLIYVNTIESYPSAFYFFSIILYTLCISITLFMLIKEKKHQQNQN